MRLRRSCLGLVGTLLVAALGLMPSVVVSQEVVVAPHLAGVAAADGWTLLNRGAEARDIGGAKGAYLDARPGLGVAWFDGVKLAEGSIEVTLQGKNVPQASFLGVAFRGVDDETFEVVYFRPFNFRADGPVARGHSVQYMAHPDHPWQQLRADAPGEYEAELTPAPDPEAPFKARVEFREGRVRVFVNGAGEPCLDVPALGSGEPGKVGLWVGNNSDGLFSNLQVFMR